MRFAKIRIKLQSILNLNTPLINFGGGFLFNPMLNQDNLRYGLEEILVKVHALLRLDWVGYNCHMSEPNLTQACLKSVPTISISPYLLVFQYDLNR